MANTRRLAVPGAWPGWTAITTCRPSPASASTSRPWASRSPASQAAHDCTDRL